MPDYLDLDEHDTLLDHVADIERCVARDAEALALAQARLHASLRELAEWRAHVLHLSDPPAEQT